MNNTLTDLMMQWEGAAECLRLMEQCGMGTDAIIAQRDHCRGIRAQLNAACPDGSYDPTIDNVVERV